MRFHIPYSSDQVLFETTLEPIIPGLNKLNKEIDTGEGQVGSVEGKKARVSVGEPYFENLVLRLDALKEEVPHEINMMLMDFDFHFASLSCSFLPDPDCRIVWARFGVELSAVSDSGEPLDKKPIAYDVRPEEIQSKTLYERDTNLGADLKFNFGVVSAGVNLAKDNKAKEVVVYEPQVFAYGVGRSNVAWDFRNTEEKGIWGTKKDLLLIIKSPKNSKVKGKFLLGAELEYKAGKLIRLPIGRSLRKENAVEILYDLSK